MASTQTIEIDASLDQVFATLSTIESYPTWLTAIKKADVQERDSEGRATKVALVIDAGMMKDKPVLIYDWTSAPEVITFSLDDADLLTEMDGTYTLKALDADTTQVTYQLSTGVSMPIPQMMLNKAEESTISAALKELKATFE